MTCNFEIKKCSRENSVYDECVSEEKCVYKKINNAEELIEKAFWSFDTLRCRRVRSERDCFQSIVRKLMVDSFK